MILLNKKIIDEKIKRASFDFNPLNLNHHRYPDNPLEPP